MPFNRTPMFRIHVPVMLALSIVACTTAPASNPLLNAGALDTGSSLMDPRGNPLLDPRGVPLTGIAQDSGGQSLAGATVQAFAVGAQVAGSSAQLVSNAAGFYRVQTSNLKATADASGKFALTLPPGKYNLEIVSPDGTRKAWQPGVVVRSETPGDIGTVKVLPTGSIAGRLKASDSGVTNLIGAEIFVPGSSYLAKVAMDGTFTLSGIPEGDFTLVGWHPDLGEAHPLEPVKVKSGEVTQAGTLVLVPNIPAIKQLLTGDGMETDNVAPGDVLVIKGEYFGRTTGKRPEIRIQAQAVDEPAEWKDDSLQITVPSGVINGNLEVKVGNYRAKLVPLRILKSISWKSSGVAIQMLAGSQPDLLSHLEVRDSSDQIVEEVRSGERIVRRAPAVRFYLDGDEAHPFPAGKFPALSPGQHTLHGIAGSLKTDGEQVIEVLPADGQLPSPEPTPVAPSPDPGNPPVDPSSAPSATPTPNGFTYRAGYPTRGLFENPAWESYGPPVLSLARSGDGSQIVSSGHELGLRFLSPASGALNLYRPTMELFNSFELGTGDRMVAVGQFATVQFYASNSALATWVTQRSGPAFIHAAFKPGSSDVLGLDDTGRLFRFAQATGQGVLHGTLPVGARFFRVTPDGNQLVVAYADGVKVFNMTTKVVTSLSGNWNVSHLEVLPGGTRFLQADAAGEVAVRQLSDGATIWSKPLGGRVDSLAVSGDGKRFVARVQLDSSSPGFFDFGSSEVTFAAFQVDMGTFLDCWSATSDQLGLAMSNDGSRFFVGGWRGVQAWDF